jgi:hypothetical protein
VFGKGDGNGLSLDFCFLLLLLQDTDWGDGVDDGIESERQVCRR